MTVREALQIKKYGQLGSWKDLYLYSRCCGDVKQMKEIGEWARRRNRGENILLPLLNNVKQNG